MFSPGMGEPDQLVLLTLQGVKRMGDTETLPTTAGSSS